VLSEHVLGEFYQRHGRSVWTYVFRVTNNAADADDIVQEAFLRLFQADTPPSDDEGLRRYVSVDIHHDPTPGWALLFAGLILGGLLVSLFVPRRRVWVKAVADAAGTRLEYAGLARGEDPTLAAAVAELARKHREALGDPELRMDA